MILTLLFWLIVFVAVFAGMLLGAKLREGKY